MRNKTLLVTGTGGNVAQGVLRVLKNTFPEIIVVGTNLISDAPGNHLCDFNELTPYAYDDNYISEIQRIVKKHNVEAIFPTTDYESYYLSKFNNDIDAIILSSDFSAHEVFINKYKSFKRLQKIGLPFVESYEIDEFQKMKSTFKDYIVKPKEGRGSRGIHINPKNLSDFGINDMVQKYILGKEYTCAFYVAKKKQIHGLITMQRELQNGYTSYCKVVFEFDHKLKDIIQTLIQNFDIKGSCNIQFRVDEHNQIQIFEINCRISGTNAIRAQLGFKDVEYTIRDLWFGEDLGAKPKIIEGMAYRMVKEVIFPNFKEGDILNKNTDCYES